MMTFTTIPKVSRWLMVGLCACLLSIGIGLAHAAAPFYWDFINVDMALQANGDMVVTETQKYTFTADHTTQRYRYIPLAGLDRITDVAVYEGDDQLPAETGIQNNQYWIRWQHDLDAPASHTFRLQYRVVGGVKTQGTTHQIFWRALFPERSADIKQGKVTVRLPDVLAGQVNQFTSQGVAATERQIDPQTLEFTANEPLAPQDFLDIQVRFPVGILDIAETQTQDAIAVAPDATNDYDPAQTHKLSAILTALVFLSPILLPIGYVVLALLTNQPAHVRRTRRGTYTARSHGYYSGGVSGGYSGGASGGGSCGGGGGGCGGGGGSCGGGGGG